MKILIMLLGLLIITVATSAQANPAATVSEKIAQKMKDTLALSNEQKALIYEINMQIHIAKGSIRQEYGLNDSLRIYLQRVENTRDSLYRTVLSNEKYLLYKEKKVTLVSAQ